MGWYKIKKVRIRAIPSPAVARLQPSEDYLTGLRPVITDALDLQLRPEAG